MEESKEDIGKQLVIQGALCDVFQAELRISIAPSRKISLSAEIDTSLDTKRFPPASARKPANKLSFACRHLFGKFGRAMVKPLHRRGHAKVFNESLSPAIQYSLHWWKKLLSGLTLATPRIVPFGLPQVVSFGDGEGTAQIAVALWSPQGTFASRCRARPALPPLFPGDAADVSHINVIEGLAPSLLFYCLLLSPTFCALAAGVITLTTPAL